MEGYSTAIWLGIVALMVAAGALIWVWFLNNYIQEKVTPPIDSASVLLTATAKRQEELHHVQTEQEHKINRQSEEQGRIQEKFRASVESLGADIVEKVEDAKNELHQSMRSILELVVSNLDQTFAANRSAVRRDSERTDITYSTLVQGLDSLTAVLANQVFHQHLNWLSSFQQARTNLISTWGEVAADTSGQIVEETPRPENPEEQLRWSAARLVGLQEEREALESMCKALMKWFQNWLPLWQEIEALAAGSEDGKSDQVAFARQVDEILQGWQYQTELRLLQPAAGERFNQEEMRRAGEEVVEDESQVGRVVSLRRRGYAWGGRVLEPAAVIVGVKQQGGGGDA